MAEQVDIPAKPPGALVVSPTRDGGFIVWHDADPRNNFCRTAVFAGRLAECLAYIGRTYQAIDALEQSFERQVDTLMHQHAMGR